VRAPARLRPAGLAGLCAGLALAAGCGAREGGPSDAVVELWAMGREGEAVRELLPAFEAREPGVRVRVQQIPWSAAHEKLLTAFVAGALPDLVQVGTTWIPELAALGALEPLDARLAATPALPREDFFAGVLDAVRVDGTTFALPWYADTRLLFYRRDLFAEAGVAEPPRTWGAFEAALGRVTARGAGALQYGSTLLRDGSRYGDFQGPAFRAAFERYLGLFRRGLAPAAGASQLANLHQDFAAGLFASFVSGPWQLGELRRRLPAGFEARWAAAPLPGPDAPAGARPLSLAGGAGLAVVRGAERADEAWRLAAFLAEPAQQVAFYRRTGDLPARRSAWEDASLRGDAQAQAFFAQLGHAQAPPRVPEWERIASRIARHAEAAVRGSEAPGEALAALDRETDRLLEKRRFLLARGEAGGRAGAGPRPGGGGAR
jgi:multiple sugar transport system substrate-binding protein